MLVLVQAAIPPSTATTPTAATQDWRDVRLNVIMLPVGIGILVLVSLMACVCYHMR